jgi:hypothetical protein
MDAEGATKSSICCKASRASASRRATSGPVMPGGRGAAAARRAVSRGKRRRTVPASARTGAGAEATRPIDIRALNGDSAKHLAHRSTSIS